MTIAEMFGQSTIVTLLGMGIVFGFLVTMIIVISLAGAIIHALGWDKDLQAPVPAPAPAAPQAEPAPQRVVAAVISAAITEYRKTHTHIR